MVKFQVSWRNTGERFGALSKLFHWLTALRLVGSFTLGLPVVYLGLIQLPDLVGVDRELGESLKLVHGLLSRLYLSPRYGSCVGRTTSPSALEG